MPDALHLVFTDANYTVEEKFDFSQKLNFYDMRRPVLPIISILLLLATAALASMNAAVQSTSLAASNRGQAYGWQARTAHTGVSAQQVRLVLQQGRDGYAGSADTWINSLQPEQNYGEDSLLELRSAGKASALIRFDLDLVPAIAIIDQATLRLEASQRSSATAAEVVLYGLRRSWSEVSATWQQAAAGVPWVSPGAGDAENDRYPDVIAAAHVDAVDQGYEWEITALVQTWHTGAEANHGMLLTGLDGPAVSYAFHAAESSELEMRPQLIIDYTLPALTATPSPTPTLTPTATPGTPTATPTATATPVYLAADLAVEAACGGRYAGDTTDWPALVDRYPSCRPHWPQTGPEAIYRLQLGAVTETDMFGSSEKSNMFTFSALLLYDAGAIDLDLFLLSAPHADACIAGEDVAIYLTDLPAGSYYLVVDGYLGSAGPYQLVVDCELRLDHQAYLPLFYR